MKNPLFVEEKNNTFDALGGAMMDWRFAVDVDVAD
jgi:hypothetical protein